MSGELGEPDRACSLCPRLAAYRAANAAAEPDWFNGPAPSFGDRAAQLLIVGLAPGRTGANRTGRPFTGDYAGDLLYATLAKFGFSEGVYQARPDDGLTLRDALITNAVRCAPPENKPTAAEARTCRPFLAERIASLKRLRAVITLGKVAHDNTRMALGAKAAAAPFAHGAHASLTGPHGPLAVFSSYHCSRYNTQTRRLTSDMFEAVFAQARAFLDAA
ncbi:MAG: uracil-DNA glycosylase [Maricaulaceae bacterium]